MKYKIVSLILIIPLVLMFCVFSAANIASLRVPIAVSSVSILHSSKEEINLAEGNTFQINAQVFPKNASNKGLIYSYESVNNVDLPNLQISDSGLVTASGYGTAKITVTTKDGAYKKSFILQVISTIASEIQLSLNKTEVVIGDDFFLNCKVIPNEALDKNVIFSSSNKNIVRVNELTGECRAISSGKVTLKATLENGINGKIESEIDVIVLPNITASQITFDGSQSLTENIFSDSFSAIMEINYSIFYDLGLNLNKEDIIFEYDKTKVSQVNINEIENNNGIYKFELNITGLDTNSFILKAYLNHENLKNYHSEIVLNKIVDLKDLEINLSDISSYIKLNLTASFKVVILPEDFTNYSLNVHFNNSNAIIAENNGIYYFKAKSIGKSILCVDVIVDGEIIKTYQKNIEIINPPESLNFVYNTQNFGIENLLTLADTKIENNNYVKNFHEFNFVESVENAIIEYSSSDNSIAKFIDSKLQILKDGLITITATEKQRSLLGEDEIKTSLNVRCVSGVQISTYNDLIRATKDNKQIVLANDIMLGEELLQVNENGTTSLIKSESKCAEILASEISQMETTGEWNYYKNNPSIKATTPPLINYIIKFTNNVFGNGYVLNANNITNMIDGTGSLYSFAKFRGPLNLVAIPDASVKAQDNICFIASDNVMINNVELVGANMRGIDSNDLNSLNYVGTVLEVMGDNVKVVNSRIRNGRNCIRVFGKENGNHDKINVLIESCVISNAREFLVKMGTNQKIYGEFSERDNINMASDSLSNNIWEACSPKIQNFTHLNKASLTEQSYKELVDTYNKSAEYQQLIKTNLTIKNSVLHTSGLFSIGIESSFAGPALDGGRWNSWNFNDYGWRNIAGTSYPTMLNLEGDVRLYDWKNISHIDSSTLIEGGLFNFNISELVENLYTNENFTDIITEIDGEKYAHGGIVVYGGGKNYALVNTSLSGVENFNNYIASLDSLKTVLTSMLKYASGREPFRILMYGKNSSFNYYKQITDMQSGEAYSGLKKYLG